MVGLLVWSALLGCDPSFRQVGPGIPRTTDTAATGTNQTGLSCDKRTQDGTCLDFIGSGWDASSASNSCGAPASSAACPAPTLGACTFQAGDALSFVRNVYDGDFYDVADLTFLEADCLNNNGAWR